MLVVRGQRSVTLVPPTKGGPDGEGEEPSAPSLCRLPFGGPSEKLTCPPSSRALSQGHCAESGRGPPNTATLASLESRSVRCSFTSALTLVGQRQAPGARTKRGCPKVSARAPRLGPDGGLRRAWRVTLSTPVSQSAHWSLGTVALPQVGSLTFTFGHSARRLGLMDGQGPKQVDRQ